MRRKLRVGSFGLRWFVVAVLLTVPAAFAQEVVVDRVAYENNPPYLIFTDQINDNINLIRWHGLKPYNTISPASWSPPVIWRHPTNIADGQTADLEANLLTAETTGRRVSL